MNPNKSNLQFIISHPYSDNIIVSMSGYSSVIRDIEESITEFSIRHKELDIKKTERGFMLSPKAHMAIQHVIYDNIQKNGL